MKRFLAFKKDRPFVQKDLELLRKWYEAGELMSLECYTYKFSIRHPQWKLFELSNIDEGINKLSIGQARQYVEASVHTARGGIAVFTNLRMMSEGEQMALAIHPNIQLSDDEYKDIIRAAIIPLTPEADDTFNDILDSMI